MVIGSLVAGIVSLVCCAYFGLRASLYRKPDAPHRWLVALNPYQASWFRDQLDAVGLSYRRTALRFQRLALACFALAFISAWFLR